MDTFPLWQGYPAPRIKSATWQAGPEIAGRSDEAPPMTSSRSAGHTAGALQRQHKSADATGHYDVIGAARFEPPTRNVVAVLEPELLAVGLEQRLHQVAIQLADGVQRNLLGADRRAFADVGAVPETLDVVLRDHALDS